MRARIIVSVLLALALSLGALSSSGGAGTPPIDLDLTLAPKPFVSSGSAALASASFVNGQAGTLADVEITFDLPAGSFESASPAERCSVSEPTALSGSPTTRVSCRIGTVSGGESVVQFVTFTAPEGAGQVEVASEATYRKAWQASGRVYTRSDADSTGIAPAGSPDLVGACASSAGTLATAPASGEANPQSTSVVFDESKVLPCTPVSVGEQQRTSDNPGCPPGEKCTTQVSFVTIPALPEPAIVTITFEPEILAPGTKPKNFVLWETPDKYPAQPIRRVQECPLPAGEGSCIVEISKYKRKGIQVVLQAFGTGEDPRYAG